MRLSTEQLLSLTSIFKKRAFNKFIKKADRNLFLINLELMLKTQIPEDVLDEWLALNASVLGKIIDYNWFLTNNANNEPMLYSNSLGEYDVKNIITKTPHDNINFDISSDSILVGHKVIPRLHIISGKYYYPENPGIQNVPAEFVHEAYLVLALGYISMSSIDEFFIKSVEKFYKKNKDKIDSLRRFYSKPPTYLGGGSDGSAFDIGNGLVLKIFSDNYAYQAAKAAQERLHKFPDIAKTEAMIYDVGELGKFKDKKIFYYIMEKMKPINKYGPEYKLMYNILAIINEKIEPFIESKEWLFDKENINDPKTYPTLKLKVKRTSRLISKSIREENIDLLKNIKHTFDLNNFWLDNLVEEILIKWLTGRGDLHPGNIGSTNYGRFRYFDPSYRDWIKKLNLPSGRLS